jgi:hypothetical protein
LFDTLSPIHTQFPQIFTYLSMKSPCLHIIIGAGYRFPNQGQTCIIFALQERPEATAVAEIQYH